MPAVSAAPLRQTFEDWALQTAPSPTHLTTGPASGTTAYMETAFEDWVEQAQMDYNQPPVESTALELGGPAVDFNKDEIRWETVEGDVELRVELNDSEETLDDGTTLRRQTVTRRRVRPVSDVLIVNGISTEHRRGTDRLIDMDIEEDVLVLPPGVDNPDVSDDLRTTTNVEEVEESLEDGTPVHRRITTTTILPAPSAEDSGNVDIDSRSELTAIGQYELTETVPSLESSGGVSSSDLSRQPDDGVSEMDIEKRAEQVVARSVEAALEQVRSLSPGRYHLSH